MTEQKWKRSAEVLVERLKGKLKSGTLQGFCSLEVTDRELHFSYHISDDKQVTLIDLTQGMLSALVKMTRSLLPIHQVDVIESIKDKTSYLISTLEDETGIEYDTK